MPIPRPFHRARRPVHCRSAGAVAAGLALAVAGAGAAAPAAAQGVVTVYGGARGGGDFVEQVNNVDATVRLDSGAAFSFSVDWLLADGRQGQLFASRQRSALPARAASGTGELPVDVSYLHLGGRAFFDGPAATRGGYLVGGLGLTHLSPGLDGLSAEVRPSMNIGIGYEWALARQVALRAELRSYLTLVNSGGGLFCSGGCVVAIRGDTLTQFEGMVGLSFAFR